ncbi:MAG: hypothetical protein ABJA70_14905 [Chryseolinea sp.]
MKKSILSIALIFANVGSIACEVCKKQQPKVLRGISHGPGPQSEWDYLIVGVTALIVMVSLFYSIKWIIRPGEREKEHIKHKIFKMEQL